MLRFEAPRSRHDLEHEKRSASCKGHLDEQVEAGPGGHRGVLDKQERQFEHIHEGLADAAAGRVVPDDEVVRWLDSWGTENELPPPKCG
jgi:predicted transcriptional regulator